MPVKQVQLAKIWGVSRPAVSLMVKKGMPLDSVEAAEAWRKDPANVKQGKRKPKPPLSRRTTLDEGEKLLGAKTPGSIEEAEEFMGKLKKLRDFSNEIVRKLSKEQNYDDARKWAQLNQQVAARYLPAHKELLRLRQEHKQLISVPDAISLFCGYLARVRSQCDNMPASLCAKANPSDPEHAREILTEWRENLFKSLSQGGDIL